MYTIKDCPVPVYQDESELLRLREIVRELKPRRILEIGSLFGGTLWYWMQDAPGGLIVSVDTGVQSFDNRAEDIEEARLNLWPEWSRRFGCELKQVRSDSTDPKTVTTVAQDAPFDFIFVDGGHDYNTVMADWKNYWPLLRLDGLLAFHDIAYPDGNINNYDVGKVWREVRHNGRWIEIVSPINPEDIWGIGAIWKHSEEQTWQLEQD